jgi:O-antigen/teichoic acid export membrane protein
MASSLSGMLTAVIIARWLGPEGLGELSLVRDIGVVAVPLFTCGISQIVIREIGRVRGSENNRDELSLLLWTIFGLTILFALIAPLVTVTLSSVLADFYGFPRLAPIIRLLAVVIMVSVPYEMINAVTAGFEEFKALGVRQFVSAVLSPIIIFLCVYSGGVAGAVVSSGIINFILICMLMRHFQNEIYRPQNLGFSRPKFDTAKQLIRKSLPLLGSIIMMRPLNLIGSSTLVIYASLVQLGWFRVAYTVYGLAMVIPSALQIPLLPMFSKLGDVEEIGSQGIFLVRMIVLFSLPLFVAGIMLSRPVTVFLFGDSYSGSIGLVALMLVVAFIAIIVSVLEINIVSQGKTARQFSINVINAIVFVSAVQFLVPKYSHWGLAGAYLSTELAALALYLYCFSKTNRQCLKKTFMPLLFAAITISLAYYSSSELSQNSLLSLQFVCAIFISFLLMNKSERGALKRYVKFG